MAELSMSDALKLIHQLQNFVVHRNEKIEFLTKEVGLLHKECEILKEEVQFWKQSSTCKW